MWRDGRWAAALIRLRTAAVCASVGTQATDEPWITQAATRELFTPGETDCAAGSSPAMKVLHASLRAPNQLEKIYSWKSLSFDCKLERTSAIVDFERKDIPRESWRFGKRAAVSEACQYSANEQVHFTRFSILSQGISTTSRRNLREGCKTAQSKLAEDCRCGREEEKRFALPLKEHERSASVP